MEENPEKIEPSGQTETEELINTLEAQRKDHEKNGKFLEADTVYQHILKLRLELKRIKEQKLREKHEKETSGIDQEYIEELNSFNSDWDSRMEKFKAMCRDSEEQLRSKQATEYESAKTTLEETIPIIPKHSSQFLNLKRIQNTLVKNKNYKEAHVIQQKMAELEEKEKLTWGDDRASKIQQNLQVISKKQENEMSRLIMKAKNGFDELKKQRAAELESLLKKFQNVKKEMKTAHKLENNRLSGLHTTGSGVFKSEFSESARQIFKIKRTQAENEEVEDS